MIIEIIWQIILFGIALSMDAFAISITDGLIYSDINKKKGLAIAITFGVMQGVMPLIGYYLIELIRVIVNASTSIGGEEAVVKAGNIMSWIVTGISFVLLIFIGSKMLFEGIKGLKENQSEIKEKLFSKKEVFIMGIATSIDALAVGVSLHSGLSDNITIFLHAGIIIVITFLFCVVGVFLGHQIERLLKGKIDITSIIGGSILIILAIWILVSHCTGL